MSRDMDMRVHNITTKGYTLTSASVVHTWDGNTDQIDVANVPAGGMSPNQQHITTGFSQHDYYTINIRLDNGQTFSGHCYCDSSHSQDGGEVVIDVSEDHYNVKYYRNGQDINGDPDDACWNKSWD